MVLGGWWLGLVRRRLTQLLEETLVQTSGRLAHQHPARPLPHVLVGVQVTFGDVEKEPGGHPHGATFDQELVLTLQHPEGFVLAVLDVGWWPAPWMRQHLEERVRPAGSLA